MSAAAPPPPHQERSRAASAAAKEPCPACKANEELEIAHQAWKRKSWWHRHTVDSPGKEAGLERLAAVYVRNWNQKNIPGFFPEDDTKNFDGTWKHTCGLPVGSDLWMKKVTEYADSKGIALKRA